MNVVLIPEENYQAILSRLDAIQSRLDASQGPAPSAVIDNEQFVLMMGVSRRTAQNWRDQGLVSFSQVGAKIYYRMGDVQRLLDRHQVKAFNKR